MGVNDEWRQILRANAAGYARVALTNIAREFPSDVHHRMTAPGDFLQRPRERTPALCRPPAQLTNQSGKKGNTSCKHTTWLNCSRHMKKRAICIMSFCAFRT